MKVKLSKKKMAKYRILVKTVKSCTFLNAAHMSPLKAELILQDMLPEIKRSCKRHWINRFILVKMISY